MSDQRASALVPRDVDFVPECLEHGVLYVAEQWDVAVHACACGCGEKTVTPLGKGGWTLTREGYAVSLSPSIGNYQIACKSHYFVTRNKVEWLT